MSDYRAFSTPPSKIDAKYYEDLVRLIGKHSDQREDSQRLIAITANVVGRMLAVLVKPNDVDMALKVINYNMRQGILEVVDIMTDTVGNA
jgi:hypothetical protein